MDTFVLIGGGLAGAKAAETLRTEGFDGRVVLIGEEPEAPYERPPLSKGYLLGSDELEKARVHEPGWYEEHDVDLRTGTRAVGLDPVNPAARPLVDQMAEAVTRPKPSPPTIREIRPQRRDPFVRHAPDALQARQVRVADGAGGLGGGALAGVDDAVVLRGVRLAGFLVDAVVEQSAAALGSDPKKPRFTRREGAAFTDDKDLATRASRGLRGHRRRRGRWWSLHLRLHRMVSAFRLGIRSLV